MRKRNIALLVVAALTAGVVLAQAFNSEPPEPYVRLVGDGRPLPPVAQVYCVDHEAWVYYTRGDGTRLDPVPTGEPCEARGWDENGIPRTRRPRP